MGFLVVDYNWLRESIAANKLLDPHNYEVTSLVYFSHYNKRISAVLISFVCRSEEALKIQCYELHSDPAFSNETPK